MAAELSATGESTSWKTYGSAVMAIFETVRLHIMEHDNDNTLPVQWNDLPESMLCSQPMYNKFAKFMLEVYVGRKVPRRL